MDKDTLIRCAYHESGRVVFAYLTDYSCSKLELSNIDSGKGNSTLNGGNDNPLIQKLLNGAKPADFEKPEKAYEVASKLTIIYSAGTCARVFYENNGSVNEETELEFPGQDTVYIEMLQKFMKQCSREHPDNYMSRIIKGVFERLAKPDIWKSITHLANAAVESYDKPLNRYMIEDTLMGSGFKIKRASTSSGFGVGVSETPDEPVKTTEVKKAVPADITDESPLDIVLKNYLKKIRTDWSDSEAQAAAEQVKGLFAKYGKQ